MKFSRSSRQARTFLRALGLSILLTAVGPSSALGAEQCRSVHQSEKDFQATPLPVPELKSQLFTLWKGKLQNIDSFLQFKEFLKEMEANSSHYRPLELAVLQQLDLAPVFEKLSKEDQALILDSIRAIAARSENQSPLSAVEAWVSPLIFLREPERILRFAAQIRSLSEKGIKIQEASAGAKGLGPYNATLISAIDRLPVETKQRLMILIKNEFTQIPAQAEQLSMTGSRKLQIPVARVHRHNIEVWVHWLLKRNIRELAQELTESSTLKNRIQKIDRYFQKLDWFFQPARGGYSFSKVITAAKIVHRKFKSHLEDPRNHIDLYGSFPNGKAHFETSDLDLHLSPHLLEDISGHSPARIAREPFSLFFADFVDRTRPPNPERLERFWKNYVAAEKQVGSEVLQRAPLRTSELMTVLIPQREYSHDVADYRWYNPLVVRLHGEGAHLQILSLSGDSPHLVEIPLF